MRSSLRRLEGKGTNICKELVDRELRRGSVEVHVLGGDGVAEEELQKGEMEKREGSESELKRRARHSKELR